MKKFKYKNYIAILLFMFLIVGPTIIWNILIYMSKSDPNIMQKIDFDLGEKRYKATLSETLNLENIPRELETYYNDRAPFRSVLINFKQTFDASLEKPYRDIENGLLGIFSNKKIKDAKFIADVVDGQVKYFMDDAIDIYYHHGLALNEFDTYNPYIEYPIKYSENKNVIIGQSNWLFLNSINIPLYTGKNELSDKEIKQYVGILDGLDAMCKKYNKDVLFLICPEKEEIYSEYMPYMEIEDEKERTLYIRDYIATNSNIKYVYPKEELINAKGKYITYRKYDSHWNYVGGYIAVKKVLETLGKETIPLRNIMIDKVDMIDCELVPYGGIDMSVLSPTFEYQVYYKPEIKVKQYSVAGEKDKVSIRSVAEIDSDDNLFLIGDSFSHALVQFLYKEFKEMYFNSFSDVLDKKIDYEALLDEIKNSDIIMIELVERNDESLMTDICFTIGALLQEVYEKPTT